MSKNKKPQQEEWLKGTDAQFDSGQKGFMNLVNANYVAWGITPGDVSNLQTLQANWNTAYTAGGSGQKATRNEGDTKTKQDARRDYVKAIRQFIAQWLKKNKSVTDAQRKLLRITVPDLTKTKHKDGIKADIFYREKNMGGGKHEFTCNTFKDPTKASTAEGADGVIISYSIVDKRGLQARADTLAEETQENPTAKTNKQITDALTQMNPPAGPDECDKQKTFSGAKFILDLKSANIGKTLYAFLQWNDSKNPGRVSAPGSLITIVI
ncbi:MAG: hypothetical protein HY063_03400 [Bacteroidetes bacterium]|nr:hypothetical protein [Bacteroidota bacterium]